MLDRCLAIIQRYNSFKVDIKAENPKTYLLEPQGKGDAHIAEADNAYTGLALNNMFNEIFQNLVIGRHSYYP
jgi:hypothetical protein